MKRSGLLVGGVGLGPSDAVDKYETRTEGLLVPYSRLPRHQSSFVDDCLLRYSLVGKSSTQTRALSCLS